jgi:hypothetical protein
VAEKGPRLADVVGKGRLSRTVQIFFPKSKKNFEAGFSRAGVHGAFTSRSPLTKSLGESRPHLPYKFSLGPKGICKVFEVFYVLEVFMSWDLGHEANPKSVEPPPDREARLGKPH